MLNHQTICTCSNRPSQSVYTRQSKYDPTKTTALRNAFAVAMRKRFKTLCNAVIKKVFTEDCFGLNDQAHRITVMAGEFNFVRSADKSRAFMQWFNQQVDSGIIQMSTAEQIGRGVQNAWTNKYITDSYQRGVQRARYEAIKAGYPVPPLDKAGLAATMDTPMHIDRIGLVYSRVFTELKGITNDMDKQISGILAQGLVDGKNPRDLAKLMVKTITGPFGDLGITDSLGRFIPAERRAEMLARTEIIRAHHAATIQEYKNWGLEGVQVKAEWQTAGWNVCPRCSDLQGKIFTLAQIETMIPAHPNCRCCAIPVDITQKVTAPLASTDKVAAGFKDPAHGEYYLKQKQVYKEVFAELFGDKVPSMLTANDHLRGEMRELMKEEFPKIFSAINGWQGATTKKGAMSLKLVATKLEKGCGEMIWKKGLSEADLVLHETNEYLRMRAFCQAYMESQNMTALQLYRGTDGGTGERIVNSLQKEGMHRTSWTIQDAPLSGYTTDKKVADLFGASTGGVTVRLKIVPIDQIVVPFDLMGKMTEKFLYEKEYIILSGKRKVTLANIFYGKSGY